MGDWDILEDEADRLAAEAALAEGDQPIPYGQARRELGLPPPCAHQWKTHANEDMCRFCGEPKEKPAA